MMPAKTSVGKNEVLRLGAMRLPPPLRTKWQSKAATRATSTNGPATKPNQFITP
jgi:hypothetical protein